MYSFFRKLPFAVNGILAGNVDYGLHAFAVVCLFEAVPGDHIQLTDVILKVKTKTHMSIDTFRCGIYNTGTSRLCSQFSRRFMYRPFNDKNKNLKNNQQTSHDIPAFILYFSPRLEQQLHKITEICSFCQR